MVGSRGVFCPFNTRIIATTVKPKTKISWIFYPIRMHSAKTFLQVDKQPTRMFCRLSNTRNPRRASSLWRHVIACGAIVAARAARAALIHTINIQFCCDDCAVAGGWAEAATALDAQNGAGCTLASACNTGAPNELNRGGDVAVFCWFDRSSSSKGRCG